MVRLRPGNAAAGSSSRLGKLSRRVAEDKSSRSAVVDSEWFSQQPPLSYVFSTPFICMIDDPPSKPATRQQTQKQTYAKAAAPKRSETSSSDGEGADADAYCG